LMATQSFALASIKAKAGSIAHPAEKQMGV
jgi:hypothetical protein